jgi:hypothetical protein
MFSFLSTRSKIALHSAPSPPMHQRSSPAPSLLHHRSNTQPRHRPFSPQAAGHRPLSDSSLPPFSNLAQRKDVERETTTKRCRRDWKWAGGRRRRSEPKERVRAGGRGTCAAVAGARFCRPNFRESSRAEGGRERSNR